MPKRDNGAIAPHIYSNPAETGDGDALNDNALMLAIGHGDQEAFSILMQRHIPSMVALSRRITLNNSDADEVVQEAFLRVWTHAGRWDANGSAQFRTWLHRIVANLSIDRGRRSKALPLEVAGDPADLRVDIEGDLARSDQDLLVRDALAQLPSRQRAAVALCYFDDRTGAEAAEILGISAGAVESLLVRARRSLRDLLIHLKKED